MKGSTIAMGGCGGLILLAILAVVAGNLLMTPAMRAELKKQQDAEYAAGRATENAKIDAFFKSFNDLRQRLPAGDSLKEQVASGFSASEAPYMAVDYGWFTQFTDRGFVPAKGPSDAQLWYRDQDFRNIEIEAVPAAGMPERDSSGLLLNMNELGGVPYVAVFSPLEQDWPVLNGDGKSFQPGLFRGWVILVDWKTKKPIGQTQFTAASSPDIRSFQIGMGNQMLVGSDLKTAMEKDFIDHFWEAANAAVARICGQAGKADFASHQPYYRSASS